jgi:hypothetical protein
MNFANYAAFRTAVLQIIDGDDISQSSISASILDLIIGAGEQRLYRDVRSTTQDISFAIPVNADGTAPLPNDCIELKSVFFPGFPALTYAPDEVVQTLVQLGGTSGPAKRYTLEGDNMVFFPSQTSGTVLGRYIKRLPDISTGLNAFFLRHPDLFMYGALAESAPYIGEQSRLEEWKQRYLTIASSVNETERRRGSRGSKLQTRVA